jgi:NADH:ubiquinone oxidoreductase subunit F (NADH-binding)
MTVTAIAPHRLPRLLSDGDCRAARMAVSLDDHRGVYPLPPAPGRGPALSIVEAVERAGLRGRGGAAFPTGVKLRSVAAGRRSPVVVVNGTEGEPASNKDKTLIGNRAHLILDGALLAVAAVAATEVIVCVNRAATQALHAMQEAIVERQRREAGVGIRLLAVPDRYVAGEETALVHFINGGEAKPTATPPRVFESGVGRRPTLVDNVETLAHVAQIVRWGPQWFRQVGTPDEPGSMLATFTGDVERPGVVEVALGTPLRSLLDAAGCGAGAAQAVLMGGYYGSWISGDAAGGAALSDASLNALSSSVGCGAVGVLGHDRCGLAETARIVHWFVGESAGQCGPCVQGLPALAGAMTTLAFGDANPDVLDRLNRWCGQIDGRGGCKLPDGVVRLVRSALSVFADDVERHLDGRPCVGPSRGGAFQIPAQEHIAWR